MKTDRVNGHRFVDRTCFLPGGRVIIAELKRPKGGRRSPQQVHYIEWLQANGHEAYFFKTKEEIDAVLDR